MKFLLSLACLLLALPVHAVNLLQNSGFELGTAYWGIAEGGNCDGPLYPENFLTNGLAHSGNYSLQCRQQTVMGNCIGAFPVRLKASTAYCLSLWGYGPAGVQQRVMILNCRAHAANALFGGVDGPTFTNTLTATATWQRFYTNWVTPAGSNTAYMIRIEPVGFATGGVNGPIFHADDWQLEEVDNIFTAPTDYAPCAPVETAIVFPASRGANRFWTNETVTVPIITYNSSAGSLTVTNVWAEHNYKFDLINSNSFSATIGAGVKVTNNLTLTPLTNVIGTYRVTTWCPGYEAITIAENTFGVIPRPVPMSYPATNSHLGSMLPFERYWMTNAWDCGFKWARTLSTGRTNSLIAGQFLRFTQVTAGYPVIKADGFQYTNATTGVREWKTNDGIQAGMAMATNFGYSILGVIEDLRTSIHPQLSWAIAPIGVQGSWSNGCMWHSNYINFAHDTAAAYSPYIKYWELGNEWDTEGDFISYKQGAESGQPIVASHDFAAIVMSNKWHAIKDSFPENILISINAFSPPSFHSMSGRLGNFFYSDGIISSHVYSAGEFGAERLWTNVGAVFGVKEHWQTESGTTCKSERQNYPFEEINVGGLGLAGSHSTEGSDPVQRLAELWRNYVVWSKWPTHTKWFYHLIDEKRSVLDPQSHSIFDWDGSLTSRAIGVAAIAQLFEGSYGRSNLVNNVVPTYTTAYPSGADGGKFARGTTNCPLVVFWGTNDMMCYRAHINLPTNQFNLYDAFGNQLERTTNIVFSQLPYIVEGQAGVNSNTVWNGVLITGTNADTQPPKVIFTKHPTRVISDDEEITFKWAARDNLVAQYPQGSGSGTTNLLQYRHKLAGYDASFSAYISSPTNDYSVDAIKSSYTNVPAGSYTMFVECKDTSGNVGSNSFGLTVVGPFVPPPPPIGPAGAKVRIGITP